MKEKEFSNKIFSSGGLYGDKPDYNKVKELIDDYEYQHLAKLNNI